ncbi:hypothetical protein KY363_07215 [Candidatus Woesearchaeota archaeon]|nr:hypothetical protein [Candidatus Woesearchaeota archaeon]
MVKKKENGLSLKTTTALILIILILGFGGTMWFYALYKVVHIETHDVSIKTVEGRHLGVNVNPTFEFGKVPASGGTATKYIVLYNDQDFPVIVQFRIKGDAARFIEAEDNGFTLQPGELRKISIFAVIPDGFGVVGNFTGQAKIIFFRS